MPKEITYELDSDAATRKHSGSVQISSMCRAERDEEKTERKTLQGIFDRVTKQTK